MSLISRIFRSVLHHGESIDPTLAEWIRREIDDLLGLEPATIAVVLGVAIVVLPIGLGVAEVRRRRTLSE
jgi:hypothetical protein